MNEAKRPNGEWLKEGGDKLYSLTESEAASSGYDLNDEEGSGSLEAERMSPELGPTVRPQRCHHKRIISRTGSGGVMDSPAATLQWDYSGIRLSHSEKIPQAPSNTALTSNLIANEICPGELVNNLASSDTKMLQLIHGTVRELQNETRAENRKARVATKQLQVRKIAKGGAGGGCGVGCGRSEFPSYFTMQSSLKSELSDSVSLQPLVYA
ncbi:hypothetical protein NDU88_001724 [Pleurodeles waltl]|uniref:Uncharacterized protein n=1 Tax=Pleurodeles waltl TaxID=8319 RepID=A0AAV7NL11_PLEWA|nr:hypothetical protein NDU88_001724 [Pleurodeles waltl]